MRRRRALGIASLLALAWNLCAGTLASAAPPTEFRVAVLDVDRVRRSALAVKTIHTQLGTHVDAYRNDTQKEEQEIRAAQEELARKRSVLAPEAYTDERRKLEERLASAQARVQQRRQALERVNAEAMQQVQDVLSRIVAELAIEQQLTIILRKEYVVYISPSPELDITDQVLQRLDREMPSVRIADPGR